MAERTASSGVDVASGSSKRTGGRARASRPRRLLVFLISASILLLAVMISDAEGPRALHRVQTGPEDAVRRKVALASIPPATVPRPDASTSRLRRHARNDRRIVRIRHIPAEIPIAGPVIVDTRVRLDAPVGHAAGGVAGTGCTYHIECDDGDPCTFDSCDLTPGTPPGNGTCVHDQLADGDAGDCDDALFCNGHEVCNAAGDCETRNVPDCTAAGQACDEFQDTCADPCTTDAGCDDGLHCNGTELCGPDNVCQPGTNPCGTGAVCQENVCTATLRPCSRDAECPSTQTCSLPGPGCFGGRCCFTFVNQPPSCTANNQCIGGICDVPPGTCRECIDILRRTSAQGPSQDTADQCKEKGGIWYATDTSRPNPYAGTTCAFPGQSCPQYSGGIAPSGGFLVTVGPVSGSPLSIDPPDGPGAPFFSLGDDYHLDEPGLLYLEAFRWVGGADGIGKVHVQFHDAQGRLIDDFLADVAPQIAVRPVILDPPIVIPADGFVTIRVGNYPTPNLRVYWLSTDEPDVGTNDPNVLAFNDCQADCDPSDCTNFLGPNPGVLAFELVGTEVPEDEAPLGPCCNRTAQTCEQKHSWECTSGHCVGGTNDCRPCANDGYCPGGLCDSGIYLGDQVSCNRCVDDAPDNPLGPCTTSDDCGGGECVPRCDNAACCLPDGTCIEDSTLESCTMLGGEWLGYGTDCNPDCCVRPVTAYTGADDCLDAVVHTLTIPAQGLCRDGDDDGLTCLSSADCASPGICIRSRSVTATGDNTGASSTAENPDSCFGQPYDPFDDPGWWEAFHIDECASVLVDLCCTQPIHEPAYTILFADCPCGPPILREPYPYWDPEHEAASGEGGPYCDEGNLWARFGPLAPGTYYYPIYSSPQGHLGQYQLHITAEACPVAACCNGTECSVANILDCEAGGGFYLGPPNKFPLEPACVPNNPNFCPTGSPDCCELGGLTPGAGCGTCQTGSCCGPTATGPGTCDDQAGVVLMSEPACNAAGGTFTGGVHCKGGHCSNNLARSCNSSSDFTCGSAFCIGTPMQLSQPTPCPLCEIEGPNNCHEPTAISVNFDISEYTLGELTIADDFIPTGDTLTTLCTRGVYISTVPYSVDPATGCRFRSQLPMEDPIDKFRIRVYEDGADDTDPTTPPDLPGALFAERFASSTGEAWGVSPPRVEGLVARLVDLNGPNTFLFGPDDLTDEEYQIDFSDDPVTGLVLDDRRYWIEIMNNMDLSPLYEGEPSCIWFINHSYEGNDYAAPGAGGMFFGPKPVDLTFCLNFSFDDSTAPTGACCTCADGVCTGNLTLQQCTYLEGEWTARGECTGPDAVTCSAALPPNDTSDTPIDVTTFGDPLAATVVIPTHHYCATTSLPNALLCTDFTPPANCNAPCEGPGSDGDYVGQDLWYRYIAPDRGLLEIDMCSTGTEWDSLFAVYKGPDGADDGTGNACPVITDLASCNAAAFPDGHGAIASDEGCAHQIIGGAGRTERQIQGNTCYLIQVGAWGPTSTIPGLGFLTLRQWRIPPVDVTPCDNLFAAATNGAGGERLSRFGCFASPTAPATAGDNTTAVEVRLHTMYNTKPGHPDTPLVCSAAGRTMPALDQFEDQVRWLGPPQIAVDDTVPAQPDYIVAPLVCTPEEAAVRDWTVTALAAAFPTADPSRIFFYGAEVVPCSVYALRYCADVLSDVICSPTETLIQTSKLGDCWPPFAPDPGQPSFKDIDASVHKYKSDPFVPAGTPVGGPPEWHALLHGNVVGGYDLSTIAKVGFLDIGLIVNSYKNIAYNQQGPCDPATAIDNCGNPCDPAP